MQGASPKNLPSAIRFGGCAFLVAWFLLFFSGEIWGADFEHAPETVVALSLVSIGSCFVGLVVLDRLGARERIFMKQLGPWFIPLGALLSVGTVGIVFADLLPLPVFYVVCILIGCSGAVFICTTVLQLSRLNPRNILITSGGFFLVGILIYSFAFYVPREATLAILCVLPFLASLFFAVDRDNLAMLPTTLDRSIEGSNNVGPAIYPLSWRTVLLLSIFMLFSCVVRGYLPFTLDNAAFFYVRSLSIILMLVMAAVVVILPTLLPTKYKISNLYRVILILGAVLFALFPIFGMDNSIALVLADGYRGLAAVLTLAFFACAARHTPFFGLKNICGGLAVYVSFGVIGWLIGSVLYYTDPGDDFLRIYSSIQCVLILLAFILLYRQTEFERYLDSAEGEASEVEKEADSLDSESRAEEGSGGRWRQRLRVIAQEKALTAREEEVFVLLAKGFKAQNISERLVISYNTTRAHIRNIYQKCGVHSQQEFIDFIESSAFDTSGGDPKPLA